MNTKSWKVIQGGVIYIKKLFSKINFVFNKQKMVDLKNKLLKNMIEVK